MEPAAHSQPITRTPAHFFVSETLLAALNPFVPPALKVKPIVWMALADPLVPQICNPSVLALVHLKSLFPFMLVKKALVLISITLLLATSLLNVLRHVPLRLVYPLLLVHGMVPILLIWCGVNALPLIMVHWTFTNLPSLPYTSFTVLVLPCLFFGRCINVFVKRYTSL